MQVLNRPELLPPHEKIVAALGNFDGLHRGHRVLLKELIRLAGELNARPAVLTFHPHPLDVVNPASSPPLLLSREDKLSLMAETGVEIVFDLPFTPDFARMEPEEFIARVLVEELAVAGVVVGYNYTFGAGGRGTPETLLQAGEKHGFVVKVIPPVRAGDRVVSSTLIRSLLVDGQVEEAALLLGYPYFLRGQVVRGEEIGRRLGFPTANLVPDKKKVIPANGVYAVRASWKEDGGEEVREGVANLGYKPTFGRQRERLLEVYLFEFSGNLYGKDLKVEFHHRLRGERSFPSVDELVAQIEKDAKLARDYFRR
ncbi:MAG: riboflavin kinase / adenylyltransferase [Eubacteriales bacterium]|nr:riboflavin kinase / adenylyltransferase [Eubacteriales bacterium]